MEHYNEGMTVILIETTKNGTQSYAYKLPQKMLNENDKGQIILPKTKNFKIYSSGFYSRITGESIDESSLLKDDDIVIQRFLKEYENEYN